mmetsp:Transcript_9326/g.22075  ORF Transcript_9326/g.22075 Transcript_9326/m.22075 type:complete len:92 (+) Transcript_9326:910-1185(+)
MEPIKNHKIKETEQVFKEKQSRGEKKTKKALENFGFEKIDDITRIRFQKTKNVVFIIAKPEVFKSLIHGSFLIFGEARMENTSPPDESKED